MYAHSGWKLLQECLRLTDEIDARLTLPSLGLEELSHVESLYAQRQQVLVHLQQWWESRPYATWPSNQAREWYSLLQELLHRLTRQRELIRCLLVQAERRLQGTLAQRQCVWYAEREYNEH